ncbi:MAG: ImmA/IrrE family metallo-endopeptidase [Bacteroidales bacterium]|nr:ImmA/IrrE family metallo-endopeptidase [Bacteroidales bacterium]
MLRTVGRPTLQHCPAAVVITPGSTPVILINRDTFPLLTPGQQRFVLLHEIGHWILHTPSETAADTFAAEATAGSAPDSLRDAVRSLAAIPSIPPQRTRQLLDRCIQIDQRQQQQPSLNKTLKAMKQILFQSDPRTTHRADGASVATPDIDADLHTTDEQRTARDAEILGQIIGGNNRRRLGLRINNTFFTAETILLAGLLATAVVIAVRMRR